MKKRLVLWGKNEKDEKILIALKLIVEQNKIEIFSFADDLVTDEFYKNLREKWRNGDHLNFPEGYKEVETKLSASEPILPTTIIPDEPDLVNRVQSEWNFIVLSSRLFDTYKEELDEIKTKATKLTEFSKDVWEDLKSFWGKVQSQITEKNIFREHSNELRTETNELFDSLKVLRKKLDLEFRSKSKEFLSAFEEKLDTIEAKIEELSGRKLGNLFNELKDIQTEFRNTSFTREDRNVLWKRIDKVFKAVKTKRFGAQDSNNFKERLEKRYKGLLNAIDKMENSINRDKKELDYNQNKVDNSFGQLESQLRGAKLKMIEDRITSKEVKLKDMIKTKKELEQKIENIAKKAELEELNKRKKEVEKEMKAKIAAEIKAKAEARANDAKLIKAASAIKASKSKSKPKETKETKTDKDLIETVIAGSAILDTEKKIETKKSDEEE